MRLLVAEDEPKIGIYLQQGLTEAGFNVDRFTNGTEVLQHALSEAYDLLILDALLWCTPEGQTIRGDIQHKNTSTMATVENPGETIASEHLEKLFDRFYRADPAWREGSPSNAGLELSITRSIIEAHEGKTWCASSKGIQPSIWNFPEPD